MVKPAEKQVTARIGWCGTWFNFPENWKEICLLHRHDCAKFLAFPEVAPTTGNPHVHIYLEFPKNCKNRPSSLKHLWGKVSKWMGANGTEAQNYKYITKAPTADGVMWGIRTPYSVDISLRPWQQKIVDLLQVPADNRSIWWFWEPYGGLGKTTFQKWLFLNMERTIVLSGKCADMKNGIVEYKEKCGDYPLRILINLPRTFNTEYFSATGVEEVKDLFFYSPKFHGGMVCESSPHVMIFSNEPPPNPEAFSPGRLITVRLPDGADKDRAHEFYDWKADA